LLLPLVSIWTGLQLVFITRANSVTRWANLENKFNAHFYSGTGEKKIINLTSKRQRNNESGSKFIQRFREVRSHCYSLNLSNG
jgi:hypothetical protein